MLSRHKWHRWVIIGAMFFLASGTLSLFQLVSGKCPAIEFRYVPDLND